MMIAFGTLMQLRTPGRLMGRVSTANDVVLGTPQTALDSAVGALLVSLLDYRLIFTLMAGVGVACRRVPGDRVAPTVSAVGLATAGEDSATRTPRSCPRGCEAPVSGLE